MSRLWSPAPVLPLLLLPGAALLNKYGESRPGAVLDAALEGLLDFTTDPAVDGLCLCLFLLLLLLLFLLLLVLVLVLVLVLLLLLLPLLLL